MGNPRIVYDGTTLDFPHPASAWENQRAAVRSLVFSDAGVAASDLRNLFDRARLALENFEDADFERKLHAWWSWAARGNAYAVALDSADIVNTTLAAAAVAGATTIQLASVAGIVVGRRYKVREVAGNEEEAVEVVTIASPNVTITVGLKYGYAIGDTFRSPDYLPNVRSLDEEAPWSRNQGTTFSFDHKFREGA